MRWFVGIPVPLEAARELEARVRSSPVMMDRARLSLAKDLHVTLRFFGEIAEARATAIVAALSTLRQPAFRLELTRVNAFRSVGAIYAEVAPCPSLDRLAEAVNESLAWRGCPRELRQFHPHVTLARMRRALPQAELDRWSGVWEPISFDADRLVLFRSRDRAALSPQGEERMTPDGPERGLEGRYEKWQTFYFSEVAARGVETL